MRCQKIEVLAVDETEIDYLARWPSGIGKNTLTGNGGSLTDDGLAKANARP